MKKIGSILLLVLFGLFWTVTETTRPDPFRRGRGIKKKPTLSGAVSVQRHVPPPKVRQKIAHSVLSTVRRRVALVTKLGATVAGDLRASTHATSIAPPVQGGASLFSTRAIRTTSALTLTTSTQPTAGGSTTSAATASTSNTNIPTTPTSGSSSTMSPATSGAVSGLTGTATMVTSTGTSGSTSTNPASTSPASTTTSTGSAAAPSSTTATATGPSTATSPATTSSTSTSPTSTASSTTATTTDTTSSTASTTASTPATTGVICGRNHYEVCDPSSNCCAGSYTCQSGTGAPPCENYLYALCCR